VEEVLGELGDGVSPVGRGADVIILLGKDLGKIIPVLSFVIDNKYIMCAHMPL
jgi:hypothetical protein